MKKSKVIKIVLALLILVFLVANWISMTNAYNNGTFRAGTVSEEHYLEFLLKEQIALTGTLGDISNGFVFIKYFGTNYSTAKTNAQGEILDSWNTPLQIKIVGATNFTICSAGPDKIFGNKDDFIFDSLKEGLVQP
jgi:hypothetical protein